MESRDFKKFVTRNLFSRQKSISVYYHVQYRKVAFFENLTQSKKNISERFQKIFRQKLGIFGVSAEILCLKKRKCGKN